MGKTHTPEFAYDGLGLVSHWRSPRNPWDAERHRMAGGSSAGAAVCLHEGSALLSFGTDSGGSVRTPGGDHRDGLAQDHARPLVARRYRAHDPQPGQPGPMARTMADVATAFAAVDPSCDPAALPGPAKRPRSRTYASACHRPTSGTISRRVSAKACARPLDELERGGARLVPLDLPEAAEAFEESRRGKVVAAEFHAHMRALLPDWLDTLAPIMAERMARYERPEAILAADYLDSLWALDRLGPPAADRLGRVDALVAPTVPVTPPVMGAFDDLDTYRAINTTLQRNVYLVNLLGLCAITLPVALDRAGMPVGLQLIARPHTEERLLAVGLACERALGTAGARLGTPPLLS